MSLSLRDRRVFWTLQTVGWTAFWLVYTLAELGTQPILLALQINAIFAGTGFLASLLLWRLYRPFRRAGVATILIAVVGSCVGAVVWYAADKLAFRLGGFIAWSAPWIDARDPWGNQYFVLSLAGILLAWSALYFGLLHARELHVERERALVSESLAREAQLRALRYQLSPHFLFNVLNAISALVAEGEGAMATRMIARLGEFLRVTLDDREPEVTLERELILLDTYLSIERVRFGERLRVCIEADQDVLGTRVPALLLQPIVENAVRHGVGRRATAGRITVSAVRHRDRLRVTVSDDGPGWGAARPQVGIGLRNVQERLAYLYAGDYAFDLSTGREGGAEIRLELPLRAAPGVGAARSPIGTLAAS
jgi:two-component system sensor histidine kinase AlgZ